MSEPAVIARVVDYDGLVAACRARADALNISRDTIDEVAGLPKGYASKALMANPFDGKSASGGRLSSRNLGRVSLGPMLGALGIALVVVEDTEQFARVEARLTARNSAQVRRMPANASIKIAKWLFTTRKARKAAIEQAKGMTERQRKRRARNAARARWKKVRAKRREARNAPVTTCE